LVPAAQRQSLVHGSALRDGHMVFPVMISGRHQAKEVKASDVRGIAGFGIRHSPDDCRLIGNNVRQPARFPGKDGTMGRYHPRSGLTRATEQRYRHSKAVRDHFCVNSRAEDQLRHIDEEEAKGVNIDPFSVGVGVLRQQLHDFGNRRKRTVAGFGWHQHGRVHTAVILMIAVLGGHRAGRHKRADQDKGREGKGFHKRFLVGAMCRVFARRPCWVPLLGALAGLQTTYRTQRALSRRPRLILSWSEGESNADDFRPRAAGHNTCDP